MALREYITLASINNRIFNSFTEDYRQEYIDDSNNECEDLAIRVGVQPADISAETHHKLKNYLKNYAVSRLAEDNADFSTRDTETTSEDKYVKLFKRTRYLMQGQKPECVPIVFTGGTETPVNRAVVSQRTVRG